MDFDHPTSPNHCLNQGFKDYKIAQNLIIREILSLSELVILRIVRLHRFIEDRETDGNSPVSVLLNISDGLLSNCLNVQLICSFDTDISKVDNALLRKGRLIAKYEFKELAVEKAQKFIEKLGFISQITNPMPLAAIYNQNEADFQ